MAEPVYTFDQQSMRRISAAVQKSEGVKDRTGNKWYPVKGGGGGGATLQIGKTTAEWTKTEDATLDLWVRNEDGDMEAVTKEDGTAATFTAYNLFADVAAGKFVGCMSGFLVSAECD
jgi:hypothetical protein